MCSIHAGVLAFFEVSAEQLLAAHGISSQATPAVVLLMWWFHGSMVPLNAAAEEATGGLQSFIEQHHMRRKLLTNKARSQTP